MAGEKEDKADVMFWKKRSYIMLKMLFGSITFA